ncbi:MAG: hypothetical protein HRU19_06355 [Pseudobacteriovorax sp.]|nr:hypothetical protein [Pseudobacteriovorax sp.]
MADKLYLIRVDMERFIGPATLREVRDAYRRMEFGLQDEIASSNKPWVAFDDLERINRIYPELANLIKKEMLSGWGSTEPESKVGSQSESPESKVRKSKGLFLKLGFVIMGVLLAGVLELLFKDYKWQDISHMVQDTAYARAIFYFGDKYNAKFESHMDRNQKSISKSLKKRGKAAYWLPYVRAVAFSRDGTWKGVSQKKLRGKDAANAPQDCSLAAWKNRWSNSQDKWKPFLDGKILPSEDWARLLVWDENWVKQRTINDQWKWPLNYYAACMRMARKALRKTVKLEDSIEAKIFDSRLKWAISFVNDEEYGNEFEMFGGLWSLSCIESTVDSEEINKCLENKGFSKSWKDLLDRRVKLRRARIILANYSKLSESNLKNLKSSIEKIVLKDPFIKFDYREELKFFQLLIQRGGDQESLEKMFREKKAPLKFEY